MGARHGDALLQAHQLGEHERTRHDGNRPCARRLNLRVLFRDRAGYDDRVRPCDVLCRMTFPDFDAETLQVARHRAFGEVRAAHAIAEIREHFGDAAHTDPADAHEMHVFDFVLHAALRRRTRIGGFRRFDRSHPRKPGPLLLVSRRSAMPTKCTCLTLCFIACASRRSCRELHARFCDSARRIGLADSASPSRHLEQLFAREIAQQLTQALRRELLLRNEQRGAALGQESRVERLMIVDCSTEMPSTAGTPAAASSAIVDAPERQIIRSAAA